uniref:Uncharacterized protein n=1 Tax=Fervidobacterium nodosum TaxID=2424 RepID=A0A7C5U5A1_9BACT
MSELSSTLQGYLQYFSAYLRKQFVEKTKTILLFIVVMFFPNANVKMFSLFFIMLFSIVSDIRHNRIELLTFLPFTSKMIYWYEFSFMTFLLLLSTFVGLPFYDSFLLALRDLLSAMIYLAGYYGAIITLTMLGVDGVAAAFMILIVDSLMCAWRSDSNIYRLISPSEQGNLIGSLVFSIALLFVGYLAFDKRGGKR